MNRFISVAVGALATLLLPIDGAHAGGKGNCDALLLQNARGIDSERAKKALVQLVDQSNFEALKRSGRLPAITPKGMGNGRTVGEFSQARARFFDSAGFEPDVERARGVARSLLAADAVPAYQQCVDKQAHANPGVHVWAEDITPKKLKLVIVWTPLPGRQEARLSASSAGAEPFHVDEEWPRGMKRSYAVTRMTGAEFHFVANMGGFRDSVIVAAQSMTPRPGKTARR